MKGNEAQGSVENKEKSREESGSKGSDGSEV